MLMREHACTVCVLGPLRPHTSSTGLEHTQTHTQAKILETTLGWSKGETERQHCAHASKATPAIQGHPLAPAAWHGTMERSLVLVLCIMQPGGGRNCWRERGAQAAFGAGPKSPERTIHRTTFHRL